MKQAIKKNHLNVGPGYRIYYSAIGSRIILLLCAGDKGRQEPDIQKAKEYLKDYKKDRKIHGKK